MINNIPDRCLIYATAAESAHMTEFLSKLGEPLDPASRKRW
jgi:hypothetical protein